MSNLFKSRFFLVCMIILVVLSLSAMILNIMGYSSVVSEAASFVIYPFRMAAISLVDAAGGFWEYFTAFDELKRRNEELEKQVLELQTALAESHKTQDEIDQLYQYYGLRREHPEYTLQNADVISREADNYYALLTVNRGTLHGVERLQPVISPTGIVGYVSEVGLLTSKVQLITRTSMAVGALNLRTGETCVAEGDFALEKFGLCKAVYISKDSETVVGDIMVSSGLGGIFPEGLSIGTVSKLEPDPLSQSLVAYIKPSADLENLRMLMIITGFERRFE